MHFTNMHNNNMYIMCTIIAIQQYLCVLFIAFRAQETVKKWCLVDLADNTKLGSAERVWLKREITQRSETTAIAVARMSAQG